MNQVLSQLMNPQTYIKLWNSKAYPILIFYFFIIFVTSTIGYTINQNEGFSNGLLFGIIISLFLWYQYGKKMTY